MKKNLKKIFKWLCICPLIMLLIGCPREDPSKKINDYLYLEGQNIGAIFPEFYDASISGKDIVFFQVLQIVDSSGIRKIRLGLLAGCLNLQSEARERIYGGEFLINNISIPYNDQNFYSKWYDDTLSIRTLLSDSITLEIQGNGPIVHNKAAIFLPLPRPYSIQDQPQMIVKENSFFIDSLIYYTGITNSSNVTFLSPDCLYQDMINPSKSVFIPKDMKVYVNRYDPVGNASLKIGICFLIGSIYRSSVPFNSNASLLLRIIEYKKIIPVQ